MNKIEVYANLIKDGINITNKEFNEVLNVYDCCVNVMNEFNNYKFIGLKIESNLDYLQIDEYYKILTLIIKLQELNLLGYLDYASFIEDTNMVRNGMIFIINDYLLDDNKEEYIYRHALLNSNLLDYVNYDKIKDINSIPDYYKEIIKAYDYAADFYYEHCVTFDLIECNIDYDFFLNMSYIYFWINSLFEKETDKICNFIRSTTENIPDLLDKFDLTGVTECKDTMNYVESLYNSYGRKVKEIK